MKNIISTYKPANTTYEEVLESKELTKACYTSWSQYLSSCRKPGSYNYSKEVQRVRGIRSQQVQIERQGYSYTNQIHNSKIKMTTRGHATLYWVDSEKNQVALKIKIPFAPAETEPRTLKITKGGIDLVTQSESLKTISVDKFSLKACEDERVYTIWESEANNLGLNITAVPNPNQEIEKGKPLPKLNASLDNIIEQGDEAYLLKNYLETIDFIKKKVITSLVNANHYAAYLKKKNMGADSVEFFFVEFKKFIDNDHKDHPYYHKMNTRLQDCENPQSNMKSHIFKLLRDLIDNHIVGLSLDSQKNYSFRPIKKEKNIAIRCIELTVIKSDMV